MSDTRQGMTRRDFLQRLGVAGGAAALYETMTLLGLINVPQAWAGPAQLTAGSGKGKRVLILGAGVGGAGRRLHPAQGRLRMHTARGPGPTRRAQPHGKARQRHR